MPFLRSSPAEHVPHAGQWALVAIGVAIATSVPILTSASTRVASAGALGTGWLPCLQASAALRFRQRLPVRDRGHIRCHSAQPAGQALRVRATAANGLPPSQQRKGRAAHARCSRQSGARRTPRVRALPTSCTPQRCEVVQVGAGTTPDTTRLGVVVVGRVERANPLLLSGTFDPGTDAPLLLGANTEQMAASSILENFQRSWGWVAPVDLRLVRRLGVEQYLARSNDVADLLFQSPGLVLTAPDDVLRAEDDRARRSGQRFALLGGTSAALVLGLAVVAAVSARRDHMAVIRLLLTRGATPAQLTGFSLAEALWPALLGAAVGVVGAYLAALAVWDHNVAGAGRTPWWPSDVGAARRDRGRGGRPHPAVVTGDRRARRLAGRDRGRRHDDRCRGAGLLPRNHGSRDRRIARCTRHAASRAHLAVRRSARGARWPFLPRLLARVLPRRASGFRLALADAGRATAASCGDGGGARRSVGTW